jgi:hypothetical protein
VTDSETHRQAVLKTIFEGGEGLVIKRTAFAVPLVLLAEVVHFVLQRPIVWVASIGSILLIVFVVPASGNNHITRSTTAQQSASEHGSGQ